MRKIAVVGSRDFPSTDAVALKLSSLYERCGKGFIIVSGGARGVDTRGEQTWLGFGGPVISFRPVQLEARQDREWLFGVEEWRLQPGFNKILKDPITWVDWQSAANYRNLLIAERCDEALVFWDGFSRGTRHFIDSMEPLGKRVTLVTP